MWISKCYTEIPRVMHKLQENPLFSASSVGSTYREMLHTCVAEVNPSDLLNNVHCILASGIQESCSPQHLLSRVDTLIHETNGLDNFMRFVYQMAEVDDTWKLWVDFVFVNCYSYITLYLAIRGSDWKLRISSLKQMAPLFAALMSGLSHIT